MEYIVTDLVNFANQMASGAGNVLLAFAAIGTLTMAVIQTVKDLTAARSWFNRGAVKRWLFERAASRSSSGMLHDLVILATAGDDSAFFDLEIEKLAGQISAASGVVVDYPDLHQPLLWRLAKGARATDVQLLIDRGAGGRAALEALRMASITAFDEFLDTKARVTHQIQRNIDAFQVSASFRWKWWLQVASFGVSVALAMIALDTADRDPWTSIPIGLAAGFFAPIARDLVAVLNKAKRASA